MDTTGQKIRQLRKSLGLTQKELGKNIGVSPATVTLWEKDQTLPSGDNGAKLVEILNVSWDELRGHAEFSRQVTELMTSYRNKRRLNIPGKAPPLFDKEEAKNYLKDTHFKPLNVSYDTSIPTNLLSARVFGIIEDTNGLTPDINKGDRIFIKPELPILTGTYSMFWLSDQLVVGRVTSTPGGMFLEFNLSTPGWESIPISNEDYIGRVIAIDPSWACESRAM
ncbi:MAG: helix-turn-helix transcriptional regulator [Cycloclasticus sp.]|jgi:Predicted transcriptional regulators